MNSDKRFFKIEYPYEWWLVFDKQQEFKDTLDIPYDDAGNLVPMSEDQVIYYLNHLYEENEQFKKDIHLIHMRSMFSTVKSFKGDISKRYTYDEETDTIYDTANHYGQYNQILDKKEIVMLLNEYNTLLEEDNEK